MAFLSCDISLNRSIYQWNNDLRTDGYDTPGQNGNLSKLNSYLTPLFFYLTIEKNVSIKKSLRLKSTGFSLGVTYNLLIKAHVEGHVVLNDWVKAQYMWIHSRVRQPCRNGTLPTLGNWLTLTGRHFDQKRRIRNLV